jgi:hypothetical protein
MNANFSLFLSFFLSFFLPASDLCLPSHYRCTEGYRCIWSPWMRHKVGRTSDSPSQRPLPDKTQHSQHPCPLAGFEPAIPARRRPQTQTFDRAATEIGDFRIHQSCFSAKTTILLNNRKSKVHGTSRHLTRYWTCEAVELSLHCAVQSGMFVSKTAGPIRSPVGLFPELLWQTSYNAVAPRAFTRSRWRSNDNTPNPRTCLTHELHR